MPSFCTISSCKLVKQIGDETSFHKFPFNNLEILKKWVDFVADAECIDPNKVRKQKKITKYSSVCSRHFKESDYSQSRSRRFLRKNAVPSRAERVTVSRVEQENDEPEEVEVEDPLSNDFCGLCRKSTHSLCMMDQVFINLTRKCLPTLNPYFIQKLCMDCIKQLNSFSAFIDMATASQCFTPGFIDQAINPLNHEEVNIKRNIKLEPIADFEDETGYNQVPEETANWLSPQKKCEILEIVDIKPFNFQHESYDDEDDIQILSPKQLKVELTDPDEEGSNELELIRNYMFVSTVFLQDHNYVKNDCDQVIEQLVKTENEDEMEPQSNDSSTVKICHLCHKSFKTFKKYLIHKVTAHQIAKSQRKKLKQQPSQNIRQICSRIIRSKNEKIQANSNVQKMKKKKKRSGKSHQCPTCFKCFRGPKNLYQHKISHTDNQYSCVLCDKRFKRAHGLKQHVKSIHEKQKNHICPICNYQYLLKADMNKCRHSKLKKSSS